MSLRGVIMLAVLGGALTGCEVLRAVRGCGDMPLDPSVTTPVLVSSAPAIGPDQRERRAREIMAGRFGLRVEEVRVHEQMTQAYPPGVTAYVFKLYGVDGRYFGPILLDASGAQFSEAEFHLARTIDDVRKRGKVEAQLSDAVARALPSDLVPVSFELAGPPWDGPATPWPIDLPPDQWNSFVEGHADTFFRPRVAPFVDHLRSIGARDIAPDLKAGALAKDAWVFARVPADRVCDAARRSDVLRAGYSPPMSSH
jgi:hypothetical protein